MRQDGFRDGNQDHRAPAAGGYQGETSRWRTDLYQRSSHMAVEWNQWNYAASKLVQLKIMPDVADSIEGKSNFIKVDRRTEVVPLRGWTCYWIWESSRGLFKQVHLAVALQIGASGLRLRWVVLFHPLPISAWADGKLAEVAEQVGEIGEYPKSKSTRPSR